MSGGIAFNQVPDDILVPLFAVEVNAGPPPYSSRSRTLLLGLADPILCPPNTPVIVGDDDPNDICGIGTIGAEMLLYARRENSIGEIYFLNLEVAQTAVPAVGGWTITGTATKSGTLVRYIGGEPYAIVVRKGQTAASVAAALVARVNKGYRRFNRYMRSPVTASIGTPTNKVVLTANHGGTECNSLRLQDSRLSGDERNVPGIFVTTTAMAGGVGGGDLAAGLASVAAMQFDFVGGPYSSTSHLDTMRDFLADRWNPLSQLDGHYITHRSDTLGGLTAFGATRNDPHTTILGTLSYPQPPWVITASLTGQIGLRKNLGRSLANAIEIARPMQTIVLSGLRGPQDEGNIFGAADRDALLRNGISTTTVRPDGQVACDRIITTYRTNDSGLEDRTFLDIEAVMIAAYVKRYMKNAVLGQYPRHVLREDNPNRIMGVATPDQLEACVIQAYNELHGAGIVRQKERFAEYVRVRADYENDRANFYLPISEAAQLRVFAVNLTMFLNLTPAAAQL